MDERPFDKAFGEKNVSSSEVELASARVVHGTHRQLFFRYLASESRLTSLYISLQRTHSISLDSSRFFASYRDVKVTTWPGVAVTGPCIFVGKRGCPAIIVASKSLFTFAGITDLRGEILRDLGMTPANLVDTQSKYICTRGYISSGAEIARCRRMTTTTSPTTEEKEEEEE